MENWDCMRRLQIWEVVDMVTLLGTRGTWGHNFARTAKRAPNFEKLWFDSSFR